MDTIEYVISFLLGNSCLEKYVGYEYLDKISNLSEHVKIVIVKSDFFDDCVYGTEKTLPKKPLKKLPRSNIPFLFGTSCLKQSIDGKLILYADLIASAYFLLSRYEEILKPECRDQYGRFLAKDSIVFQEGYGFRPLVDEWGMYLRNLLRMSGFDIPKEVHGLNKVWLTHDIDAPFKLYNVRSLILQYALNFLRPMQYVRRPLKVLVTGKNDPYFTFPKIIEYDRNIREHTSVPVESVYFIITARGAEYCSLRLKRFRNLISLLLVSGAKIGLHISHAGGIAPVKIKKEMYRLKKYIPEQQNISRHHYLRWCEPEQITHMEEAGITDDFTLSFADSAGFRVGTCRPYKFINPKTKNMSSIIIHPLQIMECTLDRSTYMGLCYQDAFSVCTKLIDETYKHHGELNILWHNTSFADGSYQERLYSAVLDYIAQLQPSTSSISAELPIK